jgi:hypothetical protein
MEPYEISTETDGVKIRVFRDTEFGVFFDITWGGDDEWPSAWMSESQARTFLMTLAHQYNKAFPEASCHISFELNEECE